MTALHRLAHPFALVAEGFVVGALLFFATQPKPVEAAPATPHATAAALAVHADL
jgi:hypothetical protein